MPDAVKNRACPRLQHELTALHKWSRHVTNDDTARRVRDHFVCPECPDTTWTPTRHLARDPKDQP